MEAVLSGVTAGVVGVDADSTIRLVNRSAETLLGAKEASLTGKTLAEAVPEFGAAAEARAEAGEAPRHRPDHAQAPRLRAQFRRPRHQRRHGPRMRRAMSSPSTT